MRGQWLSARGARTGGEVCFAACSGEANPHIQYGSYVVAVGGVNVR